MRKSKKWIAVLLCLSLLGISACGKYNDQANNGDNSSTAADKGGGALVVGMSSDLQTLDPANGYEVYGNMIFYALYDNLYKVYEGSEPKPSLATDCQIDESKKVYTIKIKEDVVFSSGNPLTAQDVVFSVNRTKNLKGNASVHTEILDKVEALDDYTVVFTLKEPDASFLTKLAQNSYAVLDSKTVKANGGTDGTDAATADKAGEWLNKNSAGSGAYVLESWSPNVEVVLNRNEKYWGEVKNEKVICKEIPDVNTQIQNLTQGDIDIALSIGVDNASQLEGKDGVKLDYQATSIITFLLMNQDPAIGGPMADPKVQQAVRYAINYQELLQISGESAVLPMNIVPKGFTGALEKDASYTDLKKAQALMKEAGYEAGFTVNFTVASYDSEGMAWSTLGQKIKDDLSKIGITAEIKTGDIGTVIDSYREGKEAFLLMHWQPDYPDINNQTVFLPGETVGERAKWLESSNKELADLKKIIQTESDEAKRAEAAKKLQQALNEEMPYAFLVQHPKVLGYGSNLEGVKYYEMQKINFQDVTVK